MALSFSKLYDNSQMKNHNHLRTEDKPIKKTKKKNQGALLYNNILK